MFKRNDRLLIYVQYDTRNFSCVIQPVFLSGIPKGSCSEALSSNLSS
jgi:hypothetical protein